MNELKVQTLSGSTLTLPPLWLAAKQNDQILDSLVESLYMVEADIKELLTLDAYPEPWEVPSRWSEKFHEKGLLIATTAGLIKRPMDTSRAFLSVQQRVKETQHLAPEILASLRHYFGRSASVYAFETREHPSAAECFALDTAAFLWPAAVHTVNDGKCFGVRLRRGQHMPFIGLQSGRLDGESIAEYLTTPRGHVEIEAVDLLDRIKTWVLQNLPEALDLEVILRQLTLLKLQCNPAHVYRFEQKFRNFTPIKFEDASLAELMFTDDNLQDIRDQWFGTAEASERYRNLYDAMVPTYIDDDQFLTMFKAHPSEVKRFSHSTEKRIAEGIEKFIAFFQTRQRYLKRKKK